MIEPYVTEKQCKQCRECKPVTEYHGQSAMRDGYQNICKACKNSRDRASYEARKARGIVRNRAPVVRREPLWPLPTQTLTEGLECVRLRNWRGPVSREPLRCAL
jgi:hypothetical protein